MNRAKMYQSLLDVDGQILLISQFTLFASTKRDEPSYIRSVILMLDSFVQGIS